MSGKIKVACRNVSQLQDSPILLSVVVFNVFPIGPHELELDNYAYALTHMTTRRKLLLEDLQEAQGPPSAGSGLSSVFAHYATTCHTGTFEFTVSGPAVVECRVKPCRHGSSWCLKSEEREAGVSISAQSSHRGRDACTRLKLIERDGWRGRVRPST